MTKPKIYTMSFTSVYPLYVDKAEKKERKKSEVDEIICWLTGYTQKELELQIRKQKDMETFFFRGSKSKSCSQTDYWNSLRRTSRKRRRTYYAGNSVFR